MGGSEKGGQRTMFPGRSLRCRSLPCPDVERSTQSPPARGGERFLSGHFSRALPPFGSAGRSGKKMEHGEWGKDG